MQEEFSGASGSEHFKMLWTLEIIWMKENKKGIYIAEVDGEERLECEVCIVKIR